MDFISHFIKDFRVFATIRTFWDFILDKAGNDILDDAQKHTNFQNHKNYTKHKIHSFHTPHALYVSLCAQSQKRL